MLDVVSIGASTLDIFLESDQFVLDKHKQGVFLCQKYEEKIEAKDIIFASGGGATNAAVNFARKGFQAAPVIELGRDQVAEMTLLDLAREHVNLSLIIQEPKEVSAVSVIFLSGAGSSIVTFRGASRMLTAEDIPFKKIGMSLKANGWIYLTNVGGDMKLTRSVISWAREKGRRMFWNPGGAEIEAHKGRAFSDLLNSVDILQVNRKEATALFGTNFMSDQIWKLNKIPLKLQSTVIITDGARGGIVIDGETIHRYDGLKTTMVDSTGAGDAFGGGFVSALLCGKTTKEAIEWGKKQGASVVEHIGAKAGLLSLEQISG